MKTALQLKTQIRATLWPSGEAENLVAAHNNGFQEAFGEIAKWVKCEQENSIDIIEFCKTFFKCGMTVVAAPRGVIKRVFTIVNDDYCDPVTYRQVDWLEVECKGREVMGRVGTLPSLPSSLPLGFVGADAATDSALGRSRSGIWTIHRSNIYLSPWIQSVEKICIEWDGIKTEWTDADPISEDLDYQKTIRLYAQYFHEYYYGSMPLAQAIHNVTKSGSFDEALADLIWQCEQRTKTRATDKCHCDAPRNLWPTLEERGLPPTAAGPLVLAHVGSFGSGDSIEAAVAALVQGFEPAAVLGNAPNVSSGNYDLSVGRDYHGFISPYYGAYGDGASKNKFWPSAGSEDWGNDGDISAYLAFFALPGERKYYDVCLGLVHLFVIYANDNEPPGLDETSLQAEWLKTKMMLSPATWKIVMLGDTVSINWPFRSWGADMVLNAYPNYERQDRTGMPFINNGCGGIGLDNTQNFTTGQAYFTASKHGAGKITVARCSLKYEFIDTSGAVVDSVELTKPAVGVCAPAS